MTLLEVSERRKLPVWRTVRACYATVLQNFGQLVRISWLWLLIMVPVYAAVHWLISTVWAAPGIQTMPQWVSEFAIVLPLVVELPFLASIAVAWHRLVLRHEHVSTSAYLRLDTSVWLYALCSLGLSRPHNRAAVVRSGHRLDNSSSAPPHSMPHPLAVIILASSMCPGAGRSHLPFAATLARLAGVGSRRTALAMGRLARHARQHSSTGTGNLPLHVARAIPDHVATIAGLASVSAMLRYETCRHGPPPEPIDQILDSVSTPSSIRLPTPCSRSSR